MDAFSSSCGDVDESELSNHNSEKWKKGNRWLLLLSPFTVQNANSLLMLRGFGLSSKKLTDGYIAWTALQTRPNPILVLAEKAL